MAPSVLTVRLAEPPDLAPVADLHRRAFADYAVASWAVGQADCIFVARRPGFVGFGLSERVRASMPLSTFLSTAIEDAPFSTQADDTVLSALAVEPHARRTGVARALCRARVQEARQHGSMRVLAHCVEGTGSVDLYASLGFESVCFVPGYYRNGRGMTLMALQVRDRPSM